MTVTTLDPVTALIIIDLQQGILDIPSAHPLDDIIVRSTTLARAFRERGLPVVLVNVAGAPPGRVEAASRHTGAFPDGWTDLLQALDQQPSDLLITKHTRGAFTNTGLEEQLKQLGVTQVVITGVATSAGVESTARDAHERGFHVTLVSDAVTDIDADAHEHSFTRIFPRIGETGTTLEILALLTAKD